MKLGELFYDRYGVTGFGMVCILLLIISGAFAGVVKLNEKACYATWQDSGQSATWGFYSGCRVMREDGTLVPTRVKRLRGD